MKIRKVTAAYDIPAQIYTLYCFAARITQAIAICIFAEGFLCGCSTADTGTVVNITITVAIPIRNTKLPGTATAAFLLNAITITHSGFIDNITETVII